MLLQLFFKAVLPMKQVELDKRNEGSIPFTRYLIREIGQYLGYWVITYLTKQS
jgi:hypothetical protein